MCESADGSLVGKCWMGPKHRRIFQSDYELCDTEKNSIRNSNQRGIVIHGSHNVSVVENVAFEVMGHTYMTEDGGKIRAYNMIFEIIDSHVHLAYCFLQVKWIMSSRTTLGPAQQQQVDS